MKIPGTSNSEGFELSRATFLPVDAVGIFTYGAWSPEIGDRANFLPDFLLYLASSTILQQMPTWVAPYG